MNTLIKHTSLKVIFLISFITILSNCNNHNDWYPFISEENNFKIKFPEKPSIHDPAFSSVGNATIKIDRYDYKENDLNFTASSYTYSEDLIKNAAGLDSLLDNFIQNTLFENKISISNKTNIKIKEHPGKEFKIKFKDNKNETSGVARVFLMGTNKLQVNMVTKDAKISSDFNPENTKAANYFLDSFELINEY